jgi:hypothetical protein
MALNPYPSASWQTTPFTDTETSQIRYYAGYGTTAGFGYTYSGTPVPTLDYICSQMIDAEIVVVRTNFLTILVGLESAIDGAGTNLDTDSASVWTHNKNEVADRADLYDRKRRNLCAFLNVVPGPGINDGNSGLTRG